MTEQLEKTSMPVSRHVRYNRSPKGRARDGKYGNSPKGRARMEIFYARHGGEDAYRREQYHRRQELAGCHAQPRSFLPGYVLIKALENAEIVEI